MGSPDIEYDMEPEAYLLDIISELRLENYDPELVQEKLAVLFETAPDQAAIAIIGMFARSTDNDAYETPRWTRHDDAASL